MPVLYILHSVQQRYVHSTFTYCTTVLANSDYISDDISAEFSFLLPPLPCYTPPPPPQCLKNLVQAFNQCATYTVDLLWILKSVFDSCTVFCVKIQYCRSEKAPYF